MEDLTSIDSESCLIYLIIKCWYIIDAQPFMLYTIYKHKDTARLFWPTENSYRSIEAYTWEENVKTQNKSMETVHLFLGPTERIQHRKQSSEERYVDRKSGPPDEEAIANAHYKAKGFSFVIWKFYQFSTKCRWLNIKAIPMNFSDPQPCVLRVNVESFWRIKVSNWKEGNFERH